MRSLLPVLVLLVASPAGAVPITIYAEAQFDSQSVTGWRPFQVDSITGTLTPFDTSLGTLESVRLRFGGSGGAEIVLSDLLPGDYRYRLFAEHAFFGPGGALLGSSDQVIAGGGNTILEDGSVLYAPEHFSTGVPFEARFVDGNILGSPLQDITSNLEYFLSSNQFEYTLRMRFDFQGPTFAAGQWTSLDPDRIDPTLGMAGIYYTYTPVPEPRTPLLVGIGLALMSATMRRERQRRMGRPSRW